MEDFAFITRVLSGSRLIADCSRWLEDCEGVKLGVSDV